MRDIKRIYEEEKIIEIIKTDFPGKYIYKDRELWTAVCNGNTEVFNTLSEAKKWLRGEEDEKS